jgi:adenosylcobinamide-GDP ribazoletransferase
LLSDGFRLGLTTFTVAPARGPSHVDRAIAAWAMRFAPWIGVLLGVILATVHWAVASPLKGLLTVATAALLTRGMHLDGLADTVDGLGSYRGRERALEIMRSAEVGPFGIVALVLVIGLQATALSSVGFLGVVIAYATGRLAAAIGCARGVPAARPDGLGALVAGSVERAYLALCAFIFAAVAVAAVPGRPWQGPLAVLAALAVTVVLLRHITKRLGGITGDVLGFLIEVATTIVLIGLIVV